MPKISIIIPIYNVEQYLKDCIDSLLGQTLGDIEIICVNDGSTDSSLDILNSYKDDRLIIINQPNQGQSAARNNGIKIAKGEYIGFLDSDDWADCTLCEKLYNNAKKFNSDIAICSISITNALTGEVNNTDPYMSLDIFPLELLAKHFTYKECQDFLFRICVTPWNKIYKREWLNQHNIKFVEGINFEDNIFCIETILQANKCSIVNEPLVNYRRFSETSYSCRSDYKKLDFFRVLDEIEKVLVKLDKYKEFKEYFKFHKKHTLVYWFKKIKDNKVKKEYKKLLIQQYKEFIFYPFNEYFKIFKTRRQLKRLIKNKRAVIWGASEFTKNILSETKSKNIIGIIDRNKKLKGSQINSYKIYSIADIPIINPDMIIGITQNYYKFDTIIKRNLCENKINTIPINIIFIV